MQTPATTALDRAGVDYRTTEYDPPTDGDYGHAMATALGLDPDRAGKTLIAALADNSHVVAVVPVSATLDLRALARAAGARKATMAATRDAERLSGSVVGGISPIGLRRRLPVFIDESLAGGEALVHVSGGRRGLEVSLDPRDLVRICEATVASISTGADP